MKQLLALIVLASLSAPGLAGWDEAQTALWNYVQESWKDDAEETGKWPNAYVHDKAVDWGSEWPAPRGKASMNKWTRFRDQHSKVMEYELFPMAIVIEGATGVVHYGVVTVRQGPDDEIEREMFGVVETLHKGDGGWKFLSLSSFGMGDD